MGFESIAPPRSEALEREYNLRIRHPEREAVYQAFAERSAGYRERMPCALDLRYAAGPRCLLDFFPGRGDRSPLLVFIHGGYWRALDKRIFSFVAAPFNAAGAAVALVGYDLAPAVTLTDIVAETHAALVWLGGERSLAFDRARVVVAGHSAGGHLAALLGASPASAWNGLSISGVVAISGLFDLAPLLETSVNADVRMSPDEASALSPIRATTFAARRYVVAVGALETGGFIDQSRAFAAHVEAHGCEVRYLSVPGRTHFDVLEDLADAHAPLGRSALHLLGTP